jgi:hypothetical protein
MQLNENEILGRFGIPCPCSGPGMIWKRKSRRREMRERLIEKASSCVPRGCVAVLVDRRRSRSRSAWWWRCGRCCRWSSGTTRGASCASPALPTSSGAPPPPIALLPRFTNARAGPADLSLLGDGDTVVSACTYVTLNLHPSQLASSLSRKMV